MTNTPGASLLLLVARICVAALFLTAAYMKMTGYSFFVGYFTKLGVPMPNITTPLIIATETIGGLCILAGFYVRFFGPLLGLFSIVAALYAHMNWADPMHLNHFLKNLALLGSLSLFYFTGAGRFSIDKR